MNRGTLVTELLVRLNRSTTTVYTDTIVNSHLSQAHSWAASFKKWPFPEGRISTTWASSSEEWDFEGYQADSFRFIQIGGERFQKLNFEDYQIYREKRSTGQDKVYSDFGGVVFINPNAAVSGTLTAYGIYSPADFDATDNTTETVFSDGNKEGDQAIIQEAMSYYYERVENGKLAQYHHSLAIDHLNRLWERIKEEQSRYQTHSIRGGMFKRMDVLEGGIADELNNEDSWF